MLLWEAGVIGRYAISPLLNRILAIFLQSLELCEGITSTRGTWRARGNRGFVSWPKGSKATAFTCTARKARPGSSSAKWSPARPRKRLVYARGTAWLRSTASAWSERRTTRYSQCNKRRHKWTWSRWCGTVVPRNSTFIDGLLFEASKRFKLQPPDKPDYLGAQKGGLCSVAMWSIMLQRWYYYSLHPEITIFHFLLLLTPFYLMLLKFLIKRFQYIFLFYYLKSVWLLPSLPWSLTFMVSILNAYHIFLAPKKLFKNCYQSVKSSILRGAPPIVKCHECHA